MSSTDDRSEDCSEARPEDRLRRFFEQKLLPRAEALRARGVSFFPLGPEGEAESDTGGWWQPAPTWPDLATAEPAELASRLAELWAEQGLPELEDLAEELADLARELEQGEEQSADLSPYVYVMY